MGAASPNSDFLSSCEPWPDESIIHPWSNRVLCGQFGDDINRTTTDGSHLPNGAAPGHPLRLPAISAMIVAAVAGALQTDSGQSVP